MTRVTSLIIGIALLSGCSDDPVMSQQAADLAALRRVTTPFQSFQAATSAGWNAEITPCMADASGAMGLHYGKAAIIDGTAKVEEPELLLYEPDQNKVLQLVAVEYIIPYTAHAKSDTAPVLFGQKFKQNDTFQLWGLHVWAWKDNPAGLYADWNSRVSCANAAKTMSMVH